MTVENKVIIILYLFLFNSCVPSVQSPLLLRMTVQRGKHEFANQNRKENPTFINTNSICVYHHLLLSISIANS